MSDTDNTHLRRFIHNREFVIPKYQRGYVWTESNANDLLSDIEFLLSHEDSKHYLGNIVLAERDKKDTFDVIDGQQRVTTLTMLFSSIYWHLTEEFDGPHHFPPKKEDSSETHELVDNLHNYLLITARQGFEEDNYSVKTAKPQRDTYTEIISNHPDERDVEISTLSDRYLSDVARVLDEWVRSRLTEIKQDCTGDTVYDEVVSEMHRIVETINSQMVVTEYQVEDSSEAGRIFGVLNDRGRELSVTDKVKSQLVYEASLVEDPEMESSLVNSVHDTFATVFERVGGAESTLSEVDLFLKSHWFMFAGEDDKSNQELTNVHRHISSSDAHLGDNREKTEKTKWIDAYLESLEEASKAYENISSYKDDVHSPEKERTQEANFYLQNVADTQFLAIRMAADIALEASEEEKVLDSVERFSLRGHQISKASRRFLLNVSQRYAYYLYWLSAGQTAATNTFNSCEKSSLHNFDTVGDCVRQFVRVVEEDFIDEYASDEKVQTFLNHYDVMSGDGMQGWGGVRNSTQTLRYMLYRVYKEEYNANLTISDLTRGDSQRLTIEHIWAVNEDQSLTDEYVHSINCIGNLTVLEKTHNSAVQDVKFQEKLDRFKQSEVPLYEELSGYSQTQWRREQVEGRKENLVEDILTVFS